MMNLNNKSAKLEWLEAGRGLAALAVCLVHLSNMFDQPQYLGRPLAPELFRFGFLGVDFFFVLSGFIIYFVNHNSLSDPRALKTYFWRRCIRILPTYWLVLTFAIIFNYLVQRDKYDLSLVGFLNNYLLISNSKFWVGPAWTLQYEFIFYIIFALSFLRRNIGLLAVACWVAIAAIYTLVTPNHEPLFSGISAVALSLYSTNFLLGVIVAIIYSKSKNFLPLATICIALSAFAIFMLDSGQWIFEKNAFARHVLPASIFALILMMLLVMEDKKFPAPKFLVWLGSISFTLYIWHIFPAGYLYAALAKLGLFERLAPELIFAVAIALSIGTSAAISRFFEQPILKVGRAIEKKFKR